MTLFIRTLT